MPVSGNPTFIKLGTNDIRLKCISLVIKVQKDKHYQPLSAFLLVYTLQMYTGTQVIQLCKK